MIGGFFRPESLQADKSGNGEGNEGREDRFLRYDWDGEVRKGR